MSQLEYMFEKSRIASRMNEEEIVNYGKLADEIKEKIEKTKIEIQNAKEELQKAKVYRKNRMEYEVIANVIDKHPERKETENKLTSIKKELSNLEVSIYVLIIILYFYCLNIPQMKVKFYFIVSL